MIGTLFYDDPAAEGEIERIIRRASLDHNGDVEPLVRQILEDVRQRGDEALLEYTLKFDGVRLSPRELRVRESELKEADKRVEPECKEALAAAKERIAAFHRRELRNSWMAQQGDGAILGQILRPLEKVGIYVPGGGAGYPSSVLMTAIPARLAGVERLVMVTPPGRDGSVNPHVLFAAGICGIEEIYRVGGAQAIGALAFGTATISKVDKIVGPGNIYVTTAKRLLGVEIDMLAGPSEVLILADDWANPSFIAADLLSQAEHDPRASAILITTSPTLAAEVAEEIGLQLQLGEFQRGDVAASAIRDQGALIIVKSLGEGIELTNRIAPEHLEVMVKNPFGILSRIRNAGTVLLGEYSPVAIGDYIAGPNHVLPTGGTARFSSPLGVDDFLKKTNFIAYTEAAFQVVEGQVKTLAVMEGFEAHAHSIGIRRGADER